MENKLNSENPETKIEPIVGPVPLNEEQLRALNHTQIADMRLWQHIMASRRLVEEEAPAEEGSEQAVEPKRLFGFDTVGLLLKDFINLTRVNRAFRAFVGQSPIIQNRMRDFARVLPRFTLLQQRYLSSPRVADRITRGQLTVNTAIADVAANRLPAEMSVNYYNNAPSVATQNAAIELGVSPAEARFNWFSELHNEALRAGIPFDEITGLSRYQVEAMLATRNVDNVTPLARADVASVTLTAEHIEALKKGVLFADIKTLSGLQLKAKSTGFSEDDLHQSWLSQKHWDFVNSKRFTIEEVRGLSEKQLDALSAGFKREDIKKLNAVQISLILKGFSVLQVTAPDVLKWLETIKHMQVGNIEYVIQEKTLAQGCTLEKLIGLNAVQLEALSSQCSLAQVTDPIFLELAKTYDNDSYKFQHLIGNILSSHSLADLAGLNGMQLRALNKGLTIEEVRKPVLMQLYEKFGSSFSYKIGELLKYGLKPEELAELTHLQLAGLDMEDRGVTLDKVKHPNFSESVLRAMELGHSFEDVIELQPWQHRLLAAGVSLKAVCEHNPEVTLAHVMAVQAGGNFNDIKGLSYPALQLYLATPCHMLPQGQHQTQHQGVSTVESNTPSATVFHMPSNPMSTSTGRSPSSSSTAAGSSCSSSSSSASGTNNSRASSSSSSAASGTHNRRRSSNSPS